MYLVASASQGEWRVKFLLGNSGEIEGKARTAMAGEDEACLACWSGKEKERTYRCQDMRRRSNSSQQKLAPMAGQWMISND